MSSRLPNGAVLPTGLLGVKANSMMEGFKKSYQNSSLRMGMVVASYPVNDPKNITKLAAEYDVIVFEQNENQSATPITYKNCLSSEGLGSIADFLEMTLRVQNKSGDSVDTKDQNGAIVIVMCLNGLTDKGIIIGALTHPDRTTTLTDEGPRLEGEFNGINIKVEKDGSTTLTFKGATDNDGNIIDDSQGPTTLSVEKDGSFQTSHKTITQRLDKSGVASLTADDNITNTTKKSFNVTTTENSNFNIGKNFNITAMQFAGAISGSASLTCDSGTIAATGAFGVKGATFNAEAQSLATIKAPNVVLQGNVALGGPGGLPVLILSTTFLGIGNLGGPVFSRAISGFANKVTAQ